MIEHNVQRPKSWNIITKFMYRSLFSVCKNNEITTVTHLSTKFFKQQKASCQTPAPIWLKILNYFPIGINIRFSFSLSCSSDHTSRWHMGGHSKRSPVLALFSVKFSRYNFKLDFSLIKGTHWGTYFIRSLPGIFSKSVSP